MHKNFIRTPLIWTVSPNKVQRTRIASANDFFRESYIKAEDVDILDGLDIPYCFDFVNKELICSRNLNIQDASNSIFHYDFLRENTRTILTIPWECLEKFNRVNMKYGNPVFVFSPGRCGSTLLANFFRSNNLISISEPDIYNQAVIESKKINDSNRINELKSALDFASNKLISPLIKGDGYVIIKLRLEAIYNAPLLTSNLHNPKTIFIIRNFHDWAKSILKVSSITINVNHIGTLYKKSLNSYQWLTENTDCLLIKYEELNSENIALFKKISAFLGAKDTYKNFQCFKENSQLGTYINEIKKDDIPPEKIKEIHDWWLNNAPTTLIKKIKLDYLLN